MGKGRLFPEHQPCSGKIRGTLEAEAQLPFPEITGKGAEEEVS